MSFCNTVTKLVHALPTISCILLAASVSIAHAEKGSSETETPRHVILIIGDGMDDQQITIARNYLSGAAGHLLLDEMPLRASSQVMTIEDTLDGKPVYVGDSANTATSMASGELTSRGRISTRVDSNRPIPTIVEMAAAAGFKTGLVSTASVTDATPAAFATHMSLRLCENPQTMLDITYKDIFLGECKSELKARGGLGSIAEQLADSDLDVILGGGAKHFAMNAEGSVDSVTDIAQKSGFQLVTTPAEMASAKPQKRLLGLFSPGTMPVRLQGENERSAEEPEASLLHYVHRYLGEVTLPAPMHCEPNPAFAAMPTLKAMTDTALTLLQHDNTKGFFLMIESASIDKQAHERKPCGSIGELQQLNEALASALAFADQHPNTLVLVTADHAQAAQIIPNVSLYEKFPIPTYTPGKLARIITPEGSILAVNYATTNFPYSEHSGANVPLFANSEGVGIVPTFLQQRDIFAISRDYLRLD